MNYTNVYLEFFNINPHDELTYQELIHVSHLWYHKNKFHMHYSERLEELIKCF